MSVKPIPNGYRSITPYLAVSEPPAIEFYRRAFGAKSACGSVHRTARWDMPELEIGDRW